MKYSGWILVLLVISLSCSEENKEVSFPLLKAFEVTSIDENGAVFSAELFKTTYSESYEYGFVWGTVSEPGVDNAEKFVIREFTADGIFRKKISTTLIPDQIYYVRGYIHSENYLSYSNEVAFKSQGSGAPLIKEFFPQTGNLGDTITIIGENFSYNPLKNKVLLADEPCSVFFSTQDTLKVVVPSTLGQKASIISVSIAKNTQTSNKVFNLISPALNGFNQKIASFGSKITLNGDHFLQNPSTLKVCLGEIEADILNIEDQNLIIKVPDELDKKQCKISVEMNNLIVHSSDEFYLQDAVLDKFYPQIALTGSLIYIEGKHFSNVIDHNIVLIGGIEANILSATNSRLEVEIPSQDQGIYPSRDVCISVDVLGWENKFENQLHINNEWFRLSDFPGENAYDANCFFDGSIVYVLCDKSKEFWSYNPETNQWREESRFTGVARVEAAGFYLNGNIYFGSGLDGNNIDLADFWKYDTLSKTWQQLNDIPFEKRHQSVGYALGNKGYFSGGVNFQFATYTHPFEDTWEYDPQLDKWKEVKSFGELDWGGTDGFASAGALVLNEKVFFGLGWNRTNLPKGSSERMFIFSPLQNYTWEQIASFPEERLDRPISFELGGVPYFYAGTDFFRLTNAHEWVKVKTNILHDFRGGIGFSVRNKAYVGLGKSKSIWVYDPFRPTL